MWNWANGSKNTAFREAKEETGLDVFDLEFINFQQFIYDPSFWKQRHFIFFDFAAKTDSTDVVLNDEAQEYIWIEPKEALGLKLDVYTRTSIETYLKSKSEHSPHLTSRVKHAAHTFTSLRQLIEQRNRFFRFLDVIRNPALTQQLPSVSANTPNLPKLTAPQHDHLYIVRQDFFDVSRLDAGVVMRAGFIPAPFARAAGPDLAIFETLPCSPIVTSICPHARLVISVSAIVYP